LLRSLRQASRARFSCRRSLHGRSDCSAGRGQTARSNTIPARSENLVPAVPVGPGIREVAFSPDIAIDASYLPGDLHGDPADRMIIATARHLGLPIVTRDSRIIAYAEAGFVGVIAC